MLSSLYIENIAVAKNLEIQFKDGFTVITGKTGAGKSVIIDSILLLCGAKNSRELLRSGEEKASVSAIFKEVSRKKFEGSEYLPDENGEIELSRVITSDGRSSAKINRKPASIAALRDVSEKLIGIQTQDERNSFADKSAYTEILDSFAELGEEKSDYSVLYNEYCTVKGQIAELKKAMSEREMMLDILKYQKREIDSAKFTANDEEEKLLRLRTKLKSIEKVTKYSAIVTKALSSSEKGATAAYLLERAEAALEQLSDVVDGADEMAARLSGFRYEIIDIAERVQDSVGADDIGDPNTKLTQIENRLSLIEKMKRKYGSSIAEIKAKRDEITAKISDLEEGDIKLAELNKKLADLTEKTAGTAEKIREKRTQTAIRLSEKIISSLKFLDMPKVRFKISVKPEKDSLGRDVFKPDGADDVDFLISVNTGEDMQSLGKVSSGGELSRITLAIKTAFAEKTDIGTLIFDEIDAGVSGGTSERIGIMLNKLAKNAQVVAVTHSPQIASIAKTHFLIEKNESDGRTESHISEITGDARIYEIARIIGGIAVTEKQTAAAHEMLMKNDNK